MFRVGAGANEISRIRLQSLTIIKEQTSRADFELKRTENQTVDNYNDQILILSRIATNDFISQLRC